MSRNDWACILFIILGFLLFLYGANYYNNIIGWTGVFLIAGGIAASIVMYVYGAINKRAQTATEAQPVQNP